MKESDDIRHEVLHGLHGLPPEDVLFGTSSAMRTLREAAEKFAATTVPVLIAGETGTGKDVLALYLHRQSPWSASPFFKLSCPLFRCSPADEDPLAEAVADLVSTLEPGWGEQPALHATLLLDDVGFIDKVMQVRLLERLRESTVLPVRLPAGQALELRLLCTTNRPLDGIVRNGHFLRELYYLIGVFKLDLPPLRGRREDLARLTSYFLELYSRKLGLPRLPPSPLIFRRMHDYDWPGNLRELENLIMRYVVQGSETAFTGEFLGQGKQSPLLSR